MKINILLISSILFLFNDNYCYSYLVVKTTNQKPINLHQSLLFDYVSTSINNGKIQALSTNPIVKASIQEVRKNLKIIKLDNLILLSIISSFTFLTSPNMNRYKVHNILANTIQKFKEICTLVISLFAFKRDSNYNKVKNVATNTPHTSRISNQPGNNDNDSSKIGNDDNDKDNNDDIIIQSISTTGSGTPEQMIIFPIQNLFHGNQEKRKFFRKVMNEPIYNQFLSRYYYSIYGKYAEKSEMFERFIEDPNINLWLSNLLHKYKEVAKSIDNPIIPFNTYSYDNMIVNSNINSNGIPIILYQDHHLRKNALKLSIDGFCNLLIEYANTFKHAPRLHDKIKSIAIGKFYNWLQSKITSKQDPLYILLSTKSKELKESLDARIEFQYKYHKHHNHLVQNKIKSYNGKYHPDAYWNFQKMSDIEKFQEIYEYINLHQRIPAFSVLYKYQPIGSYLHQFKQEIHSIYDDKYLLVQHNPILLKFINKYLIQRHILNANDLKQTTNATTLMKE